MHIRLALQTFSENQQVNPGAFLMIMYLRANESNFYRQVKNKELSAQEMLCSFIITFAFCRSIVVVSFAKVHLSSDGARSRPNRAIRCSRLAVRAVIQSGEVTEKDVLLLDGSQPCVVVGDDAQGA